MAQRAGVSISTASCVLGSRSHLFREETCARVRKASEELGYRPSSCARAMRRDRLGSVALLVSNFEHLPHLMMNAIEKVMADNDIHVSTVWISPDPREHARKPPPRILRERMVDGFLVSWKTLPLLETLLRRDAVPMVLLNVKQPENSVHCDEPVGIRLATQHLLELGHRRIAYVDYSASTHFSYSDREAGYRQAMGAAGLPPQIIRQPIPRSGRMDHAFQLLSAPDRPTAVVSYSHSTALPVLMTATMRLGWRVPEDLSLVTVCARRHDDSGLTIATVLEPEHDVGEAAAHMLLERIESGRSLPSQMFPARFDPGQTCVAPVVRLATGRTRDGSGRGAR